jgi:hypothetical protein
MPPCCWCRQRFISGGGIGKVHGVKFPPHLDGRVLLLLEQQQGPEDCVELNLQQTVPLVDLGRGLGGGGAKSCGLVLNANIMLSVKWCMDGNNCRVGRDVEA